MGYQEQLGVVMYLRGQELILKQLWAKPSSLTEGADAQCVFLILAEII